LAEVNTSVTQVNLHNFSQIQEQFLKGHNDSI